jgi:CRISPR system Cascade subunit CasC
MKHLELHILQSFPVSCLNRDDLNSPKTAIFGGVQRARVSSQSWKRAIRELAKELSPRFKGERTRLIVEPLKDALIAKGLSENDAIDKAKKLANEIATFDKESEKKNKLQVKTLFFTTPGELQALAKAYHEKGDFKKAVKSVYKEKEGFDVLKDAADISLFGRMVASEHTLTIEGAAMFSHAISTHKVDNEIDFFSAVDDNQKEGSGAGHTSTQEFNSSTYYRFSALNLDMLKDNEHLGLLRPEERKEVVSTFIEATLRAVPGMGKNNAGRRNSMNAYTLPGYVLGIIRDKGHPVQLVNAFEKPVWGKGGKSVLEESIEKLQTEYSRLTSTWEFLKSDELMTSTIPEKTLKQFLDEVCQYVC